MPVLHLQITGNNQDLTIPKTIAPQSITIRRAIVTRRCDPSPPNAINALCTDYLNNGGTIGIKLEWIRGDETLATETSKYNTVVVQDVPVSDSALLFSSSFPGTNTALDVSNTQYFNQTFQSSVIREKFNVKVFRNDGVTPVDMGAVQQIEQIDLFFEYVE